MKVCKHDAIVVSPETDEETLREIRLRTDMDTCTECYGVDMKNER